jgi:signal transduction histidine kinase
VKNPLGAADGYLAMVEEGIYGEREDKPRGIVTKVRRSIGQALELIKQLLDIARAEAGQLEIRRQEIDLKELVRDIADSFAAQAKAKAITLTVEPQNNLPNVYTDGTRVRQVVGNLVSNAVKYTPQGGNVVVRVQERTGAGPDARNAACIAVSDDGPGIPPDKLPMLFKEFSRFDAGAAEGAGIGLAISQKIAEALAGEIRCAIRPLAQEFHPLRFHHCFSRRPAWTHCIPEYRALCAFRATRPPRNIRHDRRDRSPHPQDREIHFRS